MSEPRPPFRSSLRSRLGDLPSWTGALTALVLLITITAILNPAFLRPVNLMNILHHNSMLGIIAVGMTLVIMLGGIDLSVGSLMAFAAGLAALALARVRAGGEGPEGLAVLVALGVALGVGGAAGLVHGLLVARGRLAPFIATLAGLVAYRSAVTWIADGGHLSARGSAVLAAIGRGIPVPFTNVGRPGGAPIPFSVPWAVVVFALVVVVGHLLLHYTRLSRHIIAIGANEEAARYAAIPIGRVKVLTYGIQGLLTGLAALLYLARFESVNSSSAGQLLELEVIAAVVIGGTRMQGGSGSVLGAAIGVLLIGVIRNMLILLDVNTFAHGLVMGLIIVAAVLAQRVGSRERG